MVRVQLQTFLYTIEHAKYCQRVTLHRSRWQLMARIQELLGEWFNRSRK